MSDKSELANAPTTASNYGFVKVRFNCPFLNFNLISYFSESLATECPEIDHDVLEHFILLAFGIFF